MSACLVHIEPLLLLLMEVGLWGGNCQDSVEESFHRTKVEYSPTIRDPPHRGGSRNLKKRGIRQLPH